jgi:hypothetical protein
MAPPLIIRPVEQADFAAWEPLWDGYNAFYGRKGETALRRKLRERPGSDSSIPESPSLRWWRRTPESSWA